MVRRRGEELRLPRLCGPNGLFFVIFGHFTSKMLHIRTALLRSTLRRISCDAVCASILVPQVGLSEDMRVTAFATAMSMSLLTGLFL